MKVLSTNTYQKGGWALNMLRHKLGDGAFWDGIQNYYAKYQNSNVLTDDFRHEMEEVSGENLESFFEQWLFVKGHPQIKWSWDYSNGKINLSIQQLQDHHVFQFPLEIGLVKDGKLNIKTIEVDQRNQNIQIEIGKQPDSIVLDPNQWTLFEDMGKI